MKQTPWRNNIYRQMSYLAELSTKEKKRFISLNVGIVTMETKTWRHHLHTRPWSTGSRRTPPAERPPPSPSWSACGNVAIQPRQTGQWTSAWDWPCPLHPTYSGARGHILLCPAGSHSRETGGSQEHHPIGCHDIGPPHEHISPSGLTHQNDIKN